MSNLVDTFHKMDGYDYQIWQYQLSHSILTIRATHRERPNHNIHLIFGNIYYLQLPIGWHGDLRLSSDEEYFDILRRANLLTKSNQNTPNILDVLRERFTCYKSEANECSIYILGKLQSIDYDVEPIYRD